MNELFSCLVMHSTILTSMV